MTLNLVMIIGNLTKVPELKTTPKGLSVTTIDLAINTGVKDQNGKWGVMFTKVTLWGKVAEAICSYAKKGTEIMVQGKLTEQCYTDRNGVERRNVLINASNAQILKQVKNKQEAGIEEDVDLGEGEAIVDDDDLPF